jgi:hypothetical protein
LKSALEEAITCFYVVYSQATRSVSIHFLNTKYLESPNDFASK